MMPPPTAREVWQKLLDEVGDDEIERAAAVSVAQAEKELAQAGFDVRAARAKAAAFVDGLGGGPPRGGKAPPR